MNVEFVGVDISLGNTAGFPLRNAQIIPARKVQREEEHLHYGFAEIQFTFSLC